MPRTRRYTLLWLFTLLALLCLVPAISAQEEGNDDAPAQEPTPFVPVIPIETEEPEAGDQPDSAAPQLPDSPAGESTDSPDAPESGAQETAPDTPAEETPDLPQRTCPAQVQEAFTAAELVCENVANGQVCIGSGVVEGVPGLEGAELNFIQPGNQARLSELEELRLQTLNTAAGNMAVIAARPLLSTVTAEGEGASAGATMYAFGDVTLASSSTQPNGGEAQPAVVLAQRGMNVRRTPDEQGVVVWQLGAGEQILAIGRTPDREWVRIAIPGPFGGAGWVYAPYLEVEGGVEALPAATADSPVPDLSAERSGSVEAFELLSAPADPTCEGTPDGGLLLQSPSGTGANLEIRINNVDIQFNGTLFVQAQADSSMRVHMLEGEATLTSGDSSESIRTGQRADIPLSANLEPGTVQVATYDYAAMQRLPLQLLPRPFNLTPNPQDVSQQETTPATPADESADDPSAADTASEPTTETDASQTGACTLTAVDEPRNLRIGPSTDFEVVRVLEPGQQVQAIGQVTGAAGFIWYESSEGWVRFDAVQSSGNCVDLPVVEAPQLATPVPTPAPDADSADAGPRLISSNLGDICEQGPVSQSRPSDGTTLAIEIGGSWEAGAGTTVRFTAAGGMLRPEYGDYIRLTASDGTILAQSGEETSLTYTFTEDREFAAAFSAANGDIVIMRVECVEQES